MTTDLDDALARLCEMQKAVISGSDAVPYADYAQEATSWWTNEVTDFTVEGVAEDLNRITYIVKMTYHGADVTEGYEGQPERSVQSLIPTVVSYFNKRRQLKRTNSDTAVAYLDPRGALVTGGHVDRNLIDGVGQKQVGIEFNLELPMIEDVTQSVF